jgi:hypothetical protein
MAEGHGIRDFSFPVCPDAANAPSVLVHIFTWAINSSASFPGGTARFPSSPLSARFDVLSSLFLAPNHPNRTAVHRRGLSVWILGDAT